MYIFKTLSNERNLITSEVIVETVIMRRQERERVVG